MRNGGAVFDRFHIQARGLKCGDRTFPAAAGTFNSDLNVSHPHFDCLFSDLLRGTLAGKWSAFTATFEPARSRAGPAQGIPFGIRNRHGGVIERRIDVRYAHRHVTFDFSFFDLGHEAFISGSSR